MTDDEIDPEKKYHHLLTFDFHILADDWDTAPDFIQRHMAVRKHDPRVDNLWLESLEVFGPSFNQPWTDNDYDRELEWGDKRRFRAKLYVLIGSFGFEDTEDYIEEIEKLEQMFDSIDLVCNRSLQNLGEVKEDG